MENIILSLTTPTVNFTLLWLIFFMVMALAEMLTPFFGLILVGAAGVVAAAFAAGGCSFIIQLVAFGVACVLSLVLLRPRILRKLHTGAHIPTRTEGLLGKEGEVTQ